MGHTSGGPGLNAFWLVVCFYLVGHFSWAVSLSVVCRDSHISLCSVLQLCCASVFALALQVAPGLIKIIGGSDALVDVSRGLVAASVVIVLSEAALWTIEGHHTVPAVALPRGVTPWTLKEFFIRLGVLPVHIVIMLSLVFHAKGGAPSALLGYACTRTLIMVGH